jgi:hypothetical protein
MNWPWVAFLLWLLAHDLASDPFEDEPDDE